MLGVSGRIIVHLLAGALDKVLIYYGFPAEALRYLKTMGIFIDNAKDQPRVVITGKEYCESVEE